MKIDFLESLVYKDVKNDIEIFEKEFKLPLSIDIGSFFLENKLYSKGGDFTSDFAKTNPDFVGTSHLKNLYVGKSYEMYPNKNYDHLTMWLISDKDNIVGVVLLEHGKETAEFCKSVSYDLRRKSKEQIAVVNMGMLSCFLKKEYREKGIVKKFFAEYLIPHFENKTQTIFNKEKAMPYLIATDATWNLIKKATLPLIPVTMVSIAQSSHIWKEYHGLFLSGGYKTIKTPFDIQRGSIELEPKDKVKSKLSI